jgi:hypothetical protein
VDFINNTLIGKGGGEKGKSFWREKRGSLLNVTYKIDKIRLYYSYLEEEKDKILVN